MTEKLMAIFAFALFTGFLGILVWYVPRWDLGGVVAVTLILTGYDTALALRRHQGERKDT